MSTAGEEVKDPQRALPRAIMGALVIVVTVYVLVAVAGVGAQPLEEFSSDEQQSAGLSVILREHHRLDRRRARSSPRAR